MLDCKFKNDGSKPFETFFKKKWQKKQILWFFDLA
jgi:hypothetical protein